jgi:predicted metal-dependent hydrolase
VAPLTDKRLRRWYQTYNRVYFGGKLPTSAIVCIANVDGCWGQTFHDGIRFAIEIAPQNAICVTVAKMTLLHEMAHVNLWPRTTHGPYFEREMQRLALAGAMRGLW